MGIKEWHFLLNLLMNLGVFQWEGVVSFIFLSLASCLWRKGDFISGSFSYLVLMLSGCERYQKLALFSRDSFMFLETSLWLGIAKLPFVSFQSYLLWWPHLITTLNPRLYVPWFLCYSSRFFWETFPQDDPTQSSPVKCTSGEWRIHLALVLPNSEMWPFSTLLFPFSLL